MDRWRSHICTTSLSTKNKIKYLEKKAEKTLENMRMQDIKNTRMKLENRNLLEAMERETKRWPSLDNLDKTVTENFILPHTILNFGEYQKKLQQLAMYAE